jgi:hypothetical protein
VDSSLSGHAQAVTATARATGRHEVWQYLFESSVWSVGGLIVGYTLGRTEREIRIIKKKVAPDNDDT